MIRSKMKKPSRIVLLASVLLLSSLLTGCSFSWGGGFDSCSQTNVALAGRKYKIVSSNATGSSTGTVILYLFKVSNPTYTEAMSELYKTADVMQKGKQQALVNVIQEANYNDYILFGFKTITVRADVVEFSE